MQPPKRIHGMLAQGYSAKYKNYQDGQHDGGRPDFFRLFIHDAPRDFESH